MSTITTIASSDTITSSRTVINTNFSNLNTDKMETSVLDTDTALAANSDLKVATQKATKTYVDSKGNNNTSTAGTSAGPASSSTQTITHGLGRTPSEIRLSGQGNLVATSPGHSEGVYNSSGNHCVYVLGSQGASRSATLDNTNSIAISDSAANLSTGIINNVGATTFDIVWTVAADLSAKAVFLWTAK